MIPVKGAIVVAACHFELFMPSMRVLDGFSEISCNSQDFWEQYRGRGGQVFKVLIIFAVRNLLLLVLIQVFGCRRIGTELATYSSLRRLRFEADDEVMDVVQKMSRMRHFG